MANKLNNLTIFKRNVSNNNEQVNRAISDVQSVISAKIVSHNNIVAHNNAVARANAESVSVANAESVSVARANAESVSVARMQAQTQAKKHKVIINKSVILNNVNLI